jgi:hypothetical protein
MTLTPGTKLAPYEISGTVGAGRMGAAFGIQDTAFEAWERRGGQSQAAAGFPPWPPSSERSRWSFRPLLLRHDYRHGLRLARFFDCASVRKGAVIHNHLTELCDSERVNNPFGSSRADE